MCGRESREVPGDHTCVTVHASGCRQPGSAWVRLKGEGARSVCLWFSRSRRLNQTSLLSPGCPPCPQTYAGSPSLCPSIPLRVLPSSHSPPGKDTLLGTGADPALALSLPRWAEASFLLPKTTDEPQQKCIPRLFVLIAALYDLLLQLTVPSTLPQPDICSQKVNSQRKREQPWLTPSLPYSWFLQEPLPPGQLFSTELDLRS